MRSLLNIENLSIGHGKKVLAQHLDLHLGAGELICLMGPNGAGKSTLLRSISALQKPLGGNLFLEDKDLTKMPSRELAKKISVVLTNRVDSNLTVYKLVSMGRYPYTNWTGTMAEKDQILIQEAILRTGMQDLVNRPLYQLSDGERQKAMIARALAQDTPIILLDEPSAHLDIPNKLELLSLLRKLSRESGKGILLSIHDLDAALQIADKIWLMDEEGKVLQGIPEDLVLEGQIQKLFSSEGLAFDMELGSFRISQEPESKVYLEGQEAGKSWTKRALHRKGFEISPNPSDDIPCITINVESGSWIWKLKKPGEKGEFGSIEALLEKLS
ncbi:MAG: ABC transporter ATP-binding protein [Bacteroidota bacterium]